MTRTELWGVAVYVIPPRWRSAGPPRRRSCGFVAARCRPASLAALAVSTFYLGALVLAHFLIDVAGWRLTT